MSIPAAPSPRISSRRTRVEKLLALRHQINAEIADIEAEIAAELAAMRRAKAVARTAAKGIRLPRRVVALCGTDGGYYRHRRTLKEDACDACKLAHRVAEAERQARRGAA